ncbi:MAG: sensor histidine kinase [Xanthomonadaceae bacterium]|jgi:two-component system sensor histidine kinase TctE|nr:sensor histidine kinase [Xanthomonadaceae bacterium]
MTERVPSLRQLLFRRLWLPLALLILVGAVANFLLARHYAENVHDRWLWDSAMSLTTLLQSHDGSATLEVTPAMMRMFEWDTVDRIYSQVESSALGELFANATIPAPAGNVHDSETPIFYDTIVEGQSVRAVQVIVDAGDHGYNDTITIRVAETRHKRSRLTRQLLLSSIPLQAAVLLLAGMVVWTGVATSMRTINHTARRLGSYDIDHFTPLGSLNDSPRELLPLAQAINDLIHRLDEARQVQQRFVANAAHQLRTPLAALQIELERTMRETDPAAQRAALSQVLAGLTRLRHLTHQILMLNRSESSSQDTLKMRRTDLAILAREELERDADRAIAADIDLGYEGPDEGPQIIGEPQLLRELIGNLIDNALRYGQPGGMVTLTIDSREDGSVVLAVDDDGPGIPPDQRERVLERFYRYADGGDGCGLGLAIVNEIAARHHAALKLETSPLGGLRVKLEFPAMDASPEGRLPNRSPTPQDRNA